MFDEGLLLNVIMGNGWFSQVGHSISWEIPSMQSIYIGLTNIDSLHIYMYM